MTWLAVLVWVITATCWWVAWDEERLRRAHKEIWG